MKRFILILLLVLVWAGPSARAQCNGQFGNGTVCGVLSGGPKVPGPVPFVNFAGLIGNTPPGGSPGQIQYNNTGVFNGFTMTGDCSVTVPGIICTKTNGVAFAPSATTDTTNAANITSGNLAVGRLGGGTGASATTFWRGDGAWSVPSSIVGVINVQAAPYNAKCDGITDDTSAINSAITAALAVNGGTTVQFPTATCKINGTLNVGAYTGSGPGKVVLQGTGWGSIISYTGTGTGIAVAITPAGNTFEMNHLQLIQTNTASTGMTWTSTNIARCIFCRITGGKNNLVIATSFATTIQNSLFGGTTNEAVIYGVSGTPGTDASCNASNFNYNGIYSTSGSVNTGALVVHGACESFTMIGNDIETGYIGGLFDSGIRNVVMHGDYFESFTAAPIFFQTGASYIDMVGNSFIMHTNPGLTFAGDHFHFDNNIINGLTLSFANVSFIELGNNNLTGGATITNASWNAFTPALTCGTATFTVTNANYNKLGNVTSVDLDATISALGTCTVGGMGFTLPTTPFSGAALTGRETTNSGDAISCSIIGASTALGCDKGGVPVAWVAGDRLVISGTYQNQP